jgi:hypothetical protein
LKPGTGRTVRRTRGTSSLGRLASVRGLQADEPVKRGEHGASRSHRTNPARRMSRRCRRASEGGGQTLPVEAAVGEDVRWTHTPLGCQEGVLEAIEAVLPQT